jgi:WD40 repeat protein
MGTTGCNYNILSNGSSVTSAIQLDDGNVLIEDLDGCLKMYEVKDFKCIFTRKLHERGIFSILQLDDKRIVTASFDQSVLVWKLTY